MQAEKVVIIGAGPAGIACAVQLKRYGIDPLIIEKKAIGGLVKNAWRLDNYPGYPEGISGPAFVEKLKSHLKRFDIRYLISDIRNSKFSGNSFYLDSDTEVFKCDFLVVATGTKPKYSGDGFTEVYPLRDVRDKKIAVVGAGDAAFDYAMTLSPRNTVHIHNRGTAIKCIPALLEIALKQENISYFENSSPSDSYDYTIFATGREPAVYMISDELRAMKERLVKEGLLYLIGDVNNETFRQAAVAAGDGVRAAMRIAERINTDEGNQEDSGS